MLFISAFWNFFKSNLNLSIYSSFSWIRDFHIHSSFAECNDASTFVYIVFAVYIILFIYHTTKIFFQFYALARHFYIFFLIRHIYRNAGSLALPAASKFVGKRKGDVAAIGNVEVGRRVKGPSGKRGGEGQKGEITEPRDAAENKGCLSTPRFLSSVILFILSVSSSTSSASEDHESRRHQSYP